MSIDMYLGQARSQAASVKSVCNQLSQGYSSLLQSNQQFIGTGELSSKAYDSAKAFFSAVIQPLVQGAEVGAEMTAEACQKFVDQYTSEVDSIDLKSDQLERRIQQVNQSIQNIQHINNSLPSLPLGTNPLKQINQRIIESLETTKRDLEKKLEKLLAFNATSPAIFSEVNAFYGTLAQGLQQANTSFNPSTGTFTLPQNLSWRNTVNEKWKVYQDKKRKNAKELENFSDYTIIKISTTEVSEYYQLSKAGNTPEENARISALYNKMVLEGKIIGGQKLPVGYNLNKGWQIDPHDSLTDIYSKYILSARVGKNPHTGQPLKGWEKFQFLYAGMAGGATEVGQAYYTFKAMENWGKKASGANSIITPEMEEKILWGQRKNPTKNEIIGGHSSSINNNHQNFATETIKINPDGTKDIKLVTQFPDGNLSKIKNSTVFPDGWSDTKILDSIKDVGNSPTISVRGRDGATWHRAIVDGVEIDVIKIGDNIVSGYPTGKVNAPIPGGFTK